MKHELSTDAQSTLRQLHALVTALTWTHVDDESPPYSEDDKVLCYTDGHDYGGEQYHTIKASDFYDFDPDKPDFPGTDLTKTVTHWIHDPRQAILSTTPALRELLLEVAGGIVDLMPNDVQVNAHREVARVIAQRATVHAERHSISLKQLRQDRSTSFWLKTAIDQALQRDPLDALRDAEALAAGLRKRADHLLSNPGAPDPGAGDAQ